MKYQEFSLSKIGWSVAAVLSVFIYVLYYLYLYPALSTVQVRQNLFSTYVSNENLEINISAPIYVSNFQDTPLVVSIKNINTKKMSINGNAVIAPTLPGATGILMFDNISRPNYSIPFSLKPGENVIQSVNIRLSDNTSSCVNFKIEIQPAPLPKEPDEKFLIYTKTPVMWGNLGYDWPKKYSSSECANQVDQNQANAFFYATNYPYGAFAESTLAKLLLPPWSGFSVLVLIFAIVWMLEHIISPEELKKDILTVTEALKYSLFLLISSVILLVFFTLGVIQIFQNINYQEMYFLVLMGFLIFALLFALFVSWLYKRKSIAYILLSFIVVLLAIVSLVYYMMYPIAYLCILLFLIVLLILFVLQEGLLKGVSAQKNNIDDGKGSEEKEIYEAYKKNDLLVLRKIVESNNYTDTQRRSARKRLEQVEIYLLSRVDYWGERLNLGEYDTLLQSTNIFFKDSHELKLLPDPEQILKPLLNNSEDVIFTKETSEWEFANPEKAGEIIVQAVRSKIAEADSGAPVEAQVPEKPETYVAANEPVSDSADQIHAVSVNDHIDSNSNVISSSNDFSQKNTPKAKSVRRVNKDIRKGKK